MAGRAGPSKSTLVEHHAGLVSRQIHYPEFAPFPRIMLGSGSFAVLIPHSRSPDAPENNLRRHEEEPINLSTGRGHTAYPIAVLGNWLTMLWDQSGLPPRVELLWARRRSAPAADVLMQPGLTNNCTIAPPSPWGAATVLHPSRIIYVRDVWSEAGHVFPRVVVSA